MQHVSMTRINGRERRNIGWVEAAASRQNGAEGSLFCRARMEMLLWGTLKIVSGCKESICNSSRKEWRARVRARTCMFCMNERWILD